MRTIASALVIAALGATTAVAQERHKDGYQNARSPQVQAQAGRPAANASDICNTGRVVELRRPFAKSGNMFIVKVAQLEDIANTNEKADRSTAVLCEGGKALGPAHSLGDDVTKSGNGRFTHFRDSVYFSSSDNSDANANGRRYTLVVPPPKRNTTTGARR